MVEYEKIYEIVDKQAVCLVGVLLRRIEVIQKLEKEEKKTILTPSLYKTIIKELVYENSRQVKGLIRVLACGRVIFKSRTK